MAIYKTQAIIIKRKNFGEADRLITLYTQKFGKIKAIAKGVRRSKAKMIGFMEPFYLLDLQLAEGKNLDIITSTILLNDFSNIRQKEKLLNQAYFMAEILDGLVREEVESEEIFNLLSNFLTVLNQEKDKLLLSFFSIKLLSMLGHQPEIYHCVKCHEKIKPGFNYFSSNIGGILCENCFQYDLQAKNIFINTIKIMRLIIENNIEILDKLKLDNNTEKELQSILINYVQYILEKPIKSLRFI